MNNIINNVIWGIPLLFLLLSTSIVLGIRTRFIQFRYLHRIPKLLFTKSTNEGSVSAFSTSMLLLGSHIGVGNIIGVSIAIMYGGPGTIFWMWITALLCSVLAFFENTLGQLYKEKINGRYKGGTAYYILKGLDSKIYAKIVAITLFISIGLMMPMVQSSAIITSFNNTLGISKGIISVILAIVVGYLLFSKGNKFIDTVNVFVPFMALVYISLSVIILYLNYQYIDDVFLLIVNSALNKQSYYGGLMGVAFSYGIRRGAFSNESGMGTTPNISSQGDVEHPVVQGIISSFCVFVDTLVVCTLTGFMILITTKYNIVIDNFYLHKGIIGDYNLFLSETLNTITNNNGLYVFTVLIFFFAFTSIFGSYVNAESNLFFIFKKNKKSLKSLTVIYKLIFISLIVVTGYIDTNLSWLIADLGLGLIGWVNIIAIILLTNVVLDAINDYKLKYK